MSDDRPTIGCLLRAKESKSGVPYQPRLWRSRWLQRRTVAATLLLFVSLIASLFIIWQIDVSSNGIPISTTNHYSWTYGPTAILVVVISLWRQIDYHCKLIQPWTELKNGPIRAPNTVLLDYISPLQITSFLRAIRRGHYAVAASVSGFAVLKLVMVISTTLLQPSSTIFSDSFPVMINSAFNGSRILNRSVFPSSDSMQQLDPVYGLPVEPLYAYFGTINGQFPDPVGIKDHMVFQSFNSSLDIKMTSLSTVVDVLVPAVTCETPTWTTFCQQQETCRELYLTLDTPTCSVGHTNSTEYGNGGIIAEPCGQNCPPSSLVYWSQRVNCSSTGLTNGNVPFNTTAPDQYRFALIAANISYTRERQPTFKSQQSDTENYFFTGKIVEVTAAICNVDYNIIKANVTHNLETNSFSMDPIHNSVRNSSRTWLPNFTGWQLSEIVYSGLASGEKMFGQARLTDTDFGSQSRGSKPLFHLMKANLSRNESFEAFFDETLMQSTASTVLSGAAAHYVQQMLLEPIRNNVTAAGTY